MKRKDDPMAYQYFRKGWDYEQGNGVKADINRALEYYHKAAALGSEIASNRLRTLNMQGDTVLHLNNENKQNQNLINENTVNMPKVKRKDDPEAYQYFRKGWDYEQGNGVKADINRALEYYHKAAALGSEIASNRLRTLNMQGDTVLHLNNENKQNQNLINENTVNMPKVKRKDDSEAYQYFRKGWDYEQGNGVKADINRALEYYHKAAALGSEIASNRLRTLNMQGDTVLHSNLSNEGEDNMSSGFYKNGHYIKYFKNVDKKIKELQKDTNKIYYVNAGRMNHGKSSLFNSLADEKDLFAIGDTRTTVAQSEKQFSDEIVFIDTPGLDASNADDMEAYAAYKKADMILFVHTVHSGELKKSEIDSINSIARLFPQKEDFWKRFCLIFTFKEELKEKELEEIKKKTISDIRENCGKYKFPVFAVSNLDYWIGRDEGAKELIEYSGIIELRNFLKDEAEQLRKTSIALRKEKVKLIIKEAVKELRLEQSKITNIIADKTEKIEQEHVKYKQRCLSLQRDKWSSDRKINNMQNEVEELKRLIQELKVEHSRDKARY